MKHLKFLIFAAVAAMTLCACQAPVVFDPDPEKFTIVAIAEDLAPMNGSAYPACDTQVLISEDLLDRLEFGKKASSGQNKDGRITDVQVFVKMKDLPFLEWLVCGVKPFKVAYRFFWYNGGNYVAASPVQTRAILPGEAARFVGKPEGIKADKYVLMLVFEDEVPESPVLACGDEAADPAEKQEEKQK